MTNSDLNLENDLCLLEQVFPSPRKPVLHLHFPSIQSAFSLHFSHELAATTFKNTSC